jgi:hypothetical protein
MLTASSGLGDRLVATHTWGRGLAPAIPGELEARAHGGQGDAQFVGAHEEGMAWVATVLLWLVDVHALQSRHRAELAAIWNVIKQLF